MGWAQYWPGVGIVGAGGGGVSRPRAPPLNSPPSFGQFRLLLTLEEKRFLAPTTYIFVFSTFR